MPPSSHSTHSRHPVLIVPGIGNSGPAHWQSLWEREPRPHDAPLVRAPFDEWDAPDRHDWVSTLDATVRELGPETVIVAHSLGTLAVAHWAATYAGRRAPVVAALLVAVPDPDGPNFPAQARNFKPLPWHGLGFPAMVAASDDDPYSSLAFSAAVAQAWGARLVSVGALGHINAASGLGDWPQGKALLEELVSAAAVGRISAA